MQKQGFLKELIKYGALNTLGSLGFSVYIFFDTFFMARGLGADGLTALNLVLPGFSLMAAVGLMLGVGGSTRFSVLRGQGDFEGADKVFTATVKAGAVIGAVFLAAAIAFTDPIVTLLGADETIHPLASTYLLTILSFSPAFIMSNIMTSFVRSDGSPKLAMAAMIAGSAVNTTLDIVFIFGFGWGMFGAALSSGISPVISLAVLSVHKIKGANSMRFIREKSGLRLVFKLCGIGLSAFFSEISTGIIMIMFNFVALGISGNVGVAAYGIVANLAVIVTSLLNGLTNGVQPLISRSLGENKPQNIRAGLKFMLAATAIIGIVMLAGGWLFPTELAAAFDRDGNAELVKSGSEGIRLYFSAFPIMGFNIAVTGFLAALERSKTSFAISLLRGGALTIPVLLVLSAVMGMDGVWLAVPAAELLTGLAAAFVLVLVRIRTKGFSMVRARECAADGVVENG